MLHICASNHIVIITSAVWVATSISIARYYGSLIARDFILICTRMMLLTRAVEADVRPRTGFCTCRLRSNRESTYAWHAHCGRRRPIDLQLRMQLACTPTGTELARPADLYRALPVPDELLCLNN